MLSPSCCLFSPFGKPIRRMLNLLILSCKSSVSEDSLPYYMTLEQRKFRGIDPLRNWKFAYNIQLALHMCSSFVSVVHPNLWFHILGINRGLCGTLEKNLHISGPSHFNSILFKGQLYITLYLWTIFWVILSVLFSRLFIFLQLNLVYCSTHPLFFLI